MTRTRFLLIFFMIGLALVAGKFGCRALIRTQRQERLAFIEGQLAEKASFLPKDLQSTLREKLDAAKTQLDQRRLSPIALDTLRQRTEAALADGHLYPREAQHIIDLLTDFPIWRDEIHAIKYMGQR